MRVWLGVFMLRILVSYSVSLVLQRSCYNKRGHMENVESIKLSSNFGIGKHPELLSLELKCQNQLKNIRFGKAQSGK